MALALFLLLIPCFGGTPISEMADSGTNSLDFRAIINRAKARVFPAVVYIKCVREVFEMGQRNIMEVSGSGFIVNPEGEALSNWHVVEKAVEVRCLLQDGRAFNARVVGSDKDTDVALLQLIIPTNSAPLPYAQLGRASDMTEGDFVMAMGAPWGMTRSISLGIVSCSRRFLKESSEYHWWLQTDAAISPGNSGGPLVNTQGEVVGINTRGMMRGGDTGFAIPVELASEVAAQLRTSGRVNWGWTGIQLQPLRNFDRNIYFPHTNGVMVAETDPESPARKAGVEAGDRIIRINGTNITALNEEDIPATRRLLALLPLKKAAVLEIARRDNVVKLELTPTEKGVVEGKDIDCPRWDFTVRSINQFDTPDLFFQRAKGVFVNGVKYPGNASKAGLQPFDIIVKIDGRDIQTLEEVVSAHQEALKNLEKRKKIAVMVLRDGLTRLVSLDYSVDYKNE